MTGQKTDVNGEQTKGETLIRASGLVKTFGDKLVVDDVNLSVGRGEVLGFLGPNGAGKSTTMRMLTGFLEPDAGRISICGKDLEDDPIGAKSHIGYLPEGSPLYSDMTAGQFLRFVAAARGLKKNHIRNRFDWVATTLGLDSVANQALDTLSKGYRRRVGLAQALIHDPDVLILDEPTDGLDPMQKHEVRGLIRKLAGDKSIIISTHILEEVEPLCTRVLVISDGRTLCDALPGELTTHASGHNAIDLELGGSLDPQQTIAQLRVIVGLREVVSLGGEGDACRFTLLPQEGQDLSEAVGGLCLSNNWIIKRLARRDGQIDEVFRELVGKANANRQTT